MGDTAHPSQAAKIGDGDGDGSVGSGSFTGEKLVKDLDPARSVESVVHNKIADAQFSLDGTKEKPMKPVNNDQRIQSRFDGSESEARIRSPSVEVKCLNQRLTTVESAAVICDFYAKGWCIKGSSCRFLHVKGNQTSNLPQVEGDIPKDSKREVHCEGLVEHGQGSRPPNHLHEIPEFMSIKRDEMVAVFSKDASSEIKKQSGSISQHGDRASLDFRDGSLFKDKFHPEYSISSSRKYGYPFSPSKIVEKQPSFQHVPPHNYQIGSLTRDASNSSSRISVAATNALLSSSISALSGSSLPFSYSSIGTTRLDSIPSSFHHGSHFSGSRQEILLPAKRKIPSNDWEPSDPYQPSFLIRSMISIPGSMYDPLHDSVESPKVKDSYLKSSFHSQGSSVENASVHQNDDERISDTLGVARNDDTLSVSSHNTNYGKNIRTIEKVVGTSIDLDFKTTGKQDNSLGSSAVKDITEATSDSRHQNQGRANSVIAKGDSLRKGNPEDDENNFDQSVKKESRELRHFRVALIDFVKELLKPKWLNGHISKAAHNKIVKKAVEKVLGTLPVDQVPTSMESVQQYLAFARGKIDKLVEGYAEIYGKV